ncbi:MAG: cytochrome c3 family protein [Candidatus Tectomicrobia bacterium]|uniref:Cytochrome c3 family protein n=1 Tax=Tectimicrobiota bacterium TaxID=2528274 RepID=A0A932M077_UNCTE|nr:cytochrome c3 family protein [Candidatus Tectomicrobia bacterium]
MRRLLIGLAAVVLIVIVMGLYLLVSSGASGPVQPIAYSHKLHAGEYQIPCQYCHSSARRSPVAGIPSVERCMGCHKIVAADKPEIQKLKSYWDRKMPIPWIRVYNQPDFVFFDHEPHVRKGIECQSCHGPIQTMERVYEAVNLNMARCVNCHRQNQVSVDCLICHR